jgi:predicted DNA-binding transcriptional regulator YafY
MVYHSASGPEAGARQLDPYALVLRAGWWYVIGYCHTRREVRTFRVDRIQDLTLQAEVFPVPTDFEAREFAARDFQGQQSVRVRFRYAPEAAHLARINRASWEALEEQPDGAVVVTASAPDLNWAASSALAYGPALEVLDPPELRRLVRDWVQAIAAMYPSEEAPDG